MADPDNEKDSETSLMIFQDLATLKNDPTYSDIVITAGTKEFHCHRAILAAVSSFFDTAFQIDMKEAREKKITLPSIDADTFSAILTSIYGGKYVLTDENIFDIWIASDLLQIPFLCSQCERYCTILCDSKMTVENCVDILCKVRLLDENAKQKALELVCENFKDCRIQLKIDLLEADEVKFVVTNNMLNVSTEDDVIESIMRWTESKINLPLSKNTNENCEEVKEENLLSILYQFENLLRSTKYLLISRHCLHGILSHHPLVLSNRRCQAIVEEISCYLSHSHLHLSWCPPAAVQREKTKLVNALILCQFDYEMDNNFSFFRMVLEDRTEHWKKLDLPELYCDSCWHKILYYMSKLLVITPYTISMLEPTTNLWHTIDIKNEDGMTKEEINFAREDMICLIGSSLYLYHCIDSRVIVYRNSNFLHTDNLKLNRFEWHHFMTMDIPNQKEVCLEAVTSLGYSHILFLSEKATKTYTILCIDGLRLTHRIYPHQLGSAYKLVTFSKENEAFVLQENGCLWTIKLGKDPLDIKLTLELSLWDEKVPLTGAVLYNDQLVIVGDFQSETGHFQDSFDLNVLFMEDELQNFDVCLPGVFQSIRKIKNINNDLDCNISLAVLLPHESSTDEFTLSSCS